MKSIFKNKRVLLADDSTTIRQIVIHGLKQMGFEASHIKAVGNGNIALAQINKIEFDLIISDWDMPGMSGLELLRNVKNGEQTRNIPFLMVTAKKDKNSIEQALEVGVDQYINKPFSMESLENAIKQTLIN